MPVKTLEKKTQSIAAYAFGPAGDEYFRLDDTFLSHYTGKKPEFGFNGLGEFVFYRTYSRLMEDGRKENFIDTAKRVVEGCYEIQRRHCNKIHIPWDFYKAQSSAQEMFEHIWNFRFLPPGRGLWMMGTKFMWERGSAALNNCFAYNTEFITRSGIKKIGDAAGTTQRVLSKGGKWVDAKISSFGKQELYKLVLRRGRHKKTIYTTENHRWFVKSKSKALAVVWGEDQNTNQTYKTRECYTSDLKVNMRMCVNYGSGINNNFLRPSVVGIMHGICNGDGTTGSPDSSHGTYLYLCGKKDAELLKFFGSEFHITDAPERGSEGAKRVADLPRFFRQHPDLNEASTYLYGWLCGYFAADGRISKKGSVQICSSDRDNLECVRSVCAILGVGCHDITSGLQTVTYNDGSKKKFVGYKITLFSDHLNDDFFLLSHHKRRFIETKKSRPKSIPQYNYWYVDSVEATGQYDEVYCAQVPDYHCFTLAGNVLTGNCAFVSTDDRIEADPAEPFCFLMDMAMLGVGVGFDTKGADKIYVRKPANRRIEYAVQDSREGWVDSLRVLIQSYTTHWADGYIEFDYSPVRPAGSDINGFGGKASGPGILEELHELVRELLSDRVGQFLSSVDIVDLMNYVGRCVVAGNVRRTAEIAFGMPDDSKYCTMKNPYVGLNDEERAMLEKCDAQYWQEWGNGDGANRLPVSLDAIVLDKLGALGPNSTIRPDVLRNAAKTKTAMDHHRWASNNSVFAEVGMDYNGISSSISVNGEPGLMWLSNMQDYGRMIDGRQPGIDGRVRGGNPCLEQSLESYELCNLVESFPANHSTPEEYMRTLKFAYLFAKTVTLLPTHNPRTNQVTLRNRRIGLSQSGVAQAFEKFGRRNVLDEFCDAGYNEIRRWDQIYSEWLCVQNSIKVTSVKPSGTVSLLAGATPGIHYPEAASHWRRVRVAKESILVDIFRASGFDVETLKADPTRTVVVKFACHDELRSTREVSIWEQVKNIVDYQRYWADNQVSCTIKFKPEEAPDIPRVLECFEDELKGISFLPLVNHGYEQAPYEECTADEVEDYNLGITDPDYTSYIMEAAGSKFCDGDKCSVI